MIDECDNSATHVFGERFYSKRVYIFHFNRYYSSLIRISHIRSTCTSVLETLLIAFFGIYLRSFKDAVLISLITQLKTALWQNIYVSSWYFTHIALFRGVEALWFPMPLQCQFELLPWGVLSAIIKTKKRKNAHVRWEGETYCIKNCVQTFSYTQRILLRST